MTQNRTESVERAMSILSAFTTEKPTMTLAEVAEETGLHKSTILRLTNSMACSIPFRLTTRVGCNISISSSATPNAWRTSDA